MATENWAAKQQRKRQELLKNKCQTLGYGKKNLSEIGVKKSFSMENRTIPTIKQKKEREKKSYRIITE